MALKKQCVLEEKECIGCGECDRCDLDPDKLCDNCMKCVNTGAEYRAIMVDDFALEAELEAKTHDHHHHDCSCCDHQH
ncbi:MAG: hypothetical protein E7316_00400 [Clostridiales bacterium]|nr:hypothetical protein [Clostridiales bacterium]